MPAEPGHRALPMAVRDFFFAKDGHELEVAFERICQASSESPPVVTDWEQEEFAFNRLFIGPGPVIAPPFASVYLDPEPQLMGRTTLLARDVYSFLGLVSPWRDSLPDDHLSLELDAAVALVTLRREYDEPRLQELHRFFLEDHLGAWLPRFVTSLSQSDEITPAVAYVARQLMDWLQAERDALQAA